MRIYIQITFLILLIMTIIGCQNSEQKLNQLVEKKYGNINLENDIIGVELELHRFKTWKDLLNRVEEIVCNDSIPKITLKTGNQLKTIYFLNPCWENFGCILIKQQNTIEIHNDTINKSDENFYPLDSLECVLKKDIENNGKNPMLSQNPDKLLISISYDQFESKKLILMLDKLIQAYEQVTNKTDIKIWLNEKIYLPPPPPTPEEPSVIEFNEKEL